MDIMSKTSIYETDPQKANDISGLIVEILNRNGLNDIKIDKKDLKQYDKSLYIFFDPCPFLQYFKSKNSAKLTKIYTYKKAERALEMFEKNELHLTNLELNEENDSSEYQEFFMRIGNISSMIPEDFKTEGIWVCDKKGELPIDKEKRSIYIYCFTNTFNMPRHWMEYANNDSGVCIEYDINVIKYDLFPNIIRFGRVHYDYGYDFDFLKEIHHSVRKKFSLSFIANGFTEFAKFYKRDKYRWEDETRLVVDLNKNKALVKQIKDGKMQGVKLVNEDKILVFKNMNNHFIRWKIKNVYCGNKIEEDLGQKISAVLAKKHGIIPFF